VSQGPNTRVAVRRGKGVGEGRGGWDCLQEISAKQAPPSYLYTAKISESLFKHSIKL